ncbi:MAG: ATP-binding protein [Promethearchaeota archaeon]
MDPKQITRTINFQHEDFGIYEITAKIIGYFDQSLKTFINPRILPNSGDPIFLATKDDLSNWLFKKKANEKWGADIGFLIHRPKENIRAVLDINKIVSTHLAVLAATGSGKSYTVGVILEELMKAKNKAAVLVLDPHGEYGTFIEAESHTAFKGKKGYSPKVQLIQPKDIHIKFCELSHTEIFRLLESLSEKMRYLLGEALREVQKENINYTVADVIQKLNDKKTQDNSSSVEGILWRIHEYIKNRQLISDSKHNKLPELLKPGKISILNMVELEERDQQITTSVLLNRILKSRISIKTGQKMVDESELLEYPVFIVIEEGHKFAPTGEQSSSAKILKTILSEGRKFGIGICLISQRPGKLNSDVLSQCMTQIIMKIINPVDQKNIENSVESVSQDIFQELPGLTQGQAIIAGDAVNTTVMVQIRERLIKHGGTSLNAGKEWDDLWEPVGDESGKPNMDPEDEEDELF